MSKEMSFKTPSDKGLDIIENNSEHLLDLATSKQGSGVDDHNSFYTFGNQSK